MVDKVTRGADAAPANAEAPVLAARSGTVMTLTLNRPAARNALSLTMIAALTREIVAVSDEPSVHAVVLAANGPAFCAGHDLKELTARRDDTDRGHKFFQETMQACSEMMLSLIHI